MTIKPENLAHKFWLSAAMLFLAAVPSAALADTSAPGKESARASSPSQSSTNPQTAPALIRYVGQYPFDAVNGISWNAHPTVKAALNATVKDRAILKAITTTIGPSAPIEIADGTIIAWSCQQHNCGDHQWSIRINPATDAATICYHNAEKTGSASRWFLPDGTEETRPGSCQ